MRFTGRLYVFLTTCALLAGTGGHARADSIPPLAGYVKAVAGAPIGYRTYVAAVTTALIAYTTDGTSAAEWLTAPVPAGDPAPTVSFRWIAGFALGTAKGAHHFHLAIDGEPVLTFAPGLNAAAREWSVTGASGAVLSFRALWDDPNGDRMGEMTLTVPTSAFPPGNPLDLRVTGEAAGVLDWYMTFEYTPAESVQAVAQPAVVPCARGACQVVDLRIVHVGPRAELSARTPDGQRVESPVRDGYQVVEFPLARVSAPVTTPISVTIGEGFEKQLSVERAPVVPRTFYVLHHSHMDVGYGMPQADAIAKQIQNVRDALALIRATRSYPDAARFRWNVESLWGAEAFLNAASARERTEFVADVRDGSIGLSANYANELTGLESAEELLHLTDYARTFERKYGVRLDTAFFSDVPNYSWSVVPALAENGVRYFSSGPNYNAALPDRGDRVGHAYANGDRPFWWRSQSGTSRLLFWMAGRGYSAFHFENLGEGFEPRYDHAAQLRTAILRYASDLQSAGYPYEMVQLRYTYPVDNGPVDPELSDFVRDWNAHFIEPKLAIATASDLMHRFERRYGRVIPSRGGDLTPYWEDGAASTASEESTALRSSARLQQAAALSAMLAPHEYDAKRYDAAWADLLMWNEHTWGAMTSASDPDGALETGEWAYKRNFALRADAESKALFDAALGRRDAGAATQFTAYNTSDWPRSGLAVLDPHESATGDTVLDAQGRAVPSQRLADGRLAFWVSEVPGLGSSRYEVVANAWKPQGDARVTGTTLTTGELAVQVDPASGAISSLRFRGREFVDRSELAGLNAYLYVAGRDPSKAATSGTARVAVAESGPLVAALTVSSDAPGTQGFVREIRVVAGSDRVDIVDRIDKTKVRDFESVHIAFPFAVADATTRVDLGFGDLIPGTDQLAGSNADFVPVRRWIDVSNATGGISLATPDAPLAEIGSLVDERPDPAGYRIWKSRTAPSPLIYSYVMNNYWRTNYRVDQEGPVTFRYALLPHGSPFSGLQASRFGDDVAEPFVVVPSTPGDAASAPFSVRGEASVASVSRDEDGREVVRLYNPDSKPAVVEVLWKGGTARRIAMAPYDLVTVAGP